MAGGAERNVHEFARLAAAWGHEVTLFAAGHPSAPREENLDGYKVVRKGSEFTTYAWARTFYGSRFRREGYDVILESITGVPWFSPLYAREPVVAIWHHAVGRTFLQELPLPLAVAGWLAEASIPAVYRNAHLVVRADVLRRELVDAGFPPERIHVVPDGPNHLVYRQGRGKSQNPTLIFVGPIKGYKHPETALGVLADLAPEFPNLHLDIIGWDRGGLSQDLWKRALRLGIQQQVTFHGWVSEREKVELLQRAWVLLQPSEREGWSLAVMEAAACGTPAVATAVGGMRESVRHGETGLLVPYGSKRAMSDAVRAVLLDRELRRTLSEGAIQWAAQFTLERNARETLAALRQACW